MHNAGIKTNRQWCDCDAALGVNWWRRSWISRPWGGNKRILLHQHLSSKAISLNLYLVTFCMHTLVHTRAHTLILIISLHAALALLGVFGSHVTARNCIGPYMVMLCHVFMLLFYVTLFFWSWDYIQQFQTIFHFGTALPQLFLDPSC